MKLDAQSLLYSLMAVNALMTLSLVIAAPGRNTEGRPDGIGLWALAMALETATWALVAFRGEVPDMVSITLANGLKAAVHALVLAAIHEFQQRPCPRWQLVGPVALTTLTALALQDDQLGRVVWCGLIYGVQMVFIARALLTHAETLAGRAWRLLVAGVFAMVVVLVLRAAAAASGQVAFAQPHGTSIPFIQLLTYVTVLATTLLGSMGFVLMVKERSDREILHLAMTDSLTQVLNRRALMASAERELARRSETPLAFLMIDVDHFKRINDTWGHPAGDEVLRQVARRLTSRLRHSDILGRYGGEEFCVVAPDTDAAGAHTLAETLRAIIGSTPIATEHGDIPVTASIGFSSRPQGAHDPLHELLAGADNALYQAKQTGRDRVVAFAAPG